MLSKKVLLIAAVVLFVVLLGYQYTVQQILAGPIRLTPDDAAVVAQGQKIYAAECAACHGAKLQGQPNWRQRMPNGRLPAPPHDETGHTWHHADAALFNLTKNGLQSIAGPDYQSDMPAYGDTLTDAEIIAVLSYIKSEWPPDARATHDEINKRAAAQ